VGSRLSARESASGYGWSGADRWARGVGGSGRERAGCASRPGREGARGAGPRGLNGGRRARAWENLVAELGPRGERKEEVWARGEEKGWAARVDRARERGGSWAAGEGKRVCGLGWCGFWVAMGLGLSFVLGFLSISPFLFLIQTITQLV